MISASVGTVVYYGFQCYPHIGQMYLLCCLLTGIAGNVFPFMDWFNQYEYRVSQIPGSPSIPLERNLTIVLIIFRCGG